MIVIEGAKNAGEATEEQIDKAYKTCSIASNTI